MNDMTIDQMLEKFKQFHQMYEERRKQGKDIGIITKEFESKRNNIFFVDTDYVPSASQLLEFSKKMANQVTKEITRISGKYLSALIRACPDKEITLDLSQLNKKGILLDYLCDGLEKKTVTMNGNVGCAVGYFAENSSIVVNGNAGYGVALCAKNLNIIINGNAKSAVGDNAKYSKITINGNTEGFIGYHARNSKIYITGGIEKGSMDLALEGTEIYQMQNGVYVRVWPR